MEPGVSSVSSRPLRVSVRRKRMGQPSPAPKRDRNQWEALDTPPGCGLSQWEAADTPPPPRKMAAPIKDREALQRLSFLLQAAHWVLPHSPPLARFLCSTHRGAARRLVLRLAPSVKRLICRRCCSLLLPGDGGVLRLRGGGQPRVVLRCRNCGKYRRFLCPPKPRPLREATPTDSAPTETLPGNSVTPRPPIGQSELQK